MILEPVLIYLFRNSLQSSICAQAEQNGHWKDIRKQSIKKAITVKVKAALNFWSWVWEIDIYYFWGHQSSFKENKRIKEKVFNRNFFKS